MNIMYLQKMNNLMKLSLNLEYNNIGNKGLSEIMLIIDELSNLINLNLEMQNNQMKNEGFGEIIDL